MHLQGVRRFLFKLLYIQRHEKVSEIQDLMSLNSGILVGVILTHLYYETEAYHNIV